jgi:hypothetical protein
MTRKRRSALLIIIAAAAALYLVEHIGSVPGQINSSISAMAGWDDDARRQYESELELNRKYEESAERLEMEKRHLANEQ